MNKLIIIKLGIAIYPYLDTQYVKEFQITVFAERVNSMKRSFAISYVSGLFQSIF